MSDAKGPAPTAPQGLTESSILTLAREYAANGFSVVPVRHGEKRPAIEWKKFQSRIATDPELQTWFADDSHGLGIVCGKVSGNLVCLDFDSDQAFDHFVQTPEHEQLVDQCAVANSARGKHVFFRDPATVPSTAIHLEGFEGKAGDLLAEGKFVVVPPTVHPDGPLRKWHRPIEQKLPVVWPETLKLKQPPKVEKVRLTLENIEEGDRHNTLLSYGAKLRNAGNDFNSIVQALSLVNQQKCRPPLAAHEVTGIAMYLAARPVSLRPDPIQVQGREDDRLDAFSILPDVGTPRDGMEDDESTDITFTPGDVYMDSRKEEPLEWLIKDIIPLTFLTVIGADSKVGKTCFVTNLAHNVTHGLPFLGKETIQSKVLWLSAEESEPERAMILCEYEDTSPNLLITHDEIFIDTPKGIRDLRIWIRRTGAKLIVIDTLMACLGRQSTSGAKDGRDALAPLKELCRVENVSAVVLHHINKNNASGMNRSRFLDSSQLLAVASVDWLMVADVLRNGDREIQMTTTGRKVFCGRKLLIHSSSITDYRLVSDTMQHEESKDAMKEKIMSIFQSSPEGLTAVQVAEKLGLEHKTIQNRLTRLTKQGEVTVVGQQGKASVYAVLTGSGNPDPSGPQGELMEA
ncbi:MAG: AAA family ATPase [Armatimonadetes bacterium]|nr:AAA family ATPase [Armatimonadota bacterium]